MTTTPEREAEPISAAVPFVHIGNRRGLTFEQLTEDPALDDFVRHFPGSFEQDHLNCVMLFVEPSDHRSKPND